MMASNDRILMCACGGKCEGICRKQNLYRNRESNSKDLGHNWPCPAAYFLAPAQPKISKKERSSHEINTSCKCGFVSGKWNIQPK